MLANDSIPVDGDAPEPLIPPPPPTMPAAPSAIRTEIEPLLDVVVERLGKRFEDALDLALDMLEKRIDERFETLERKQAARHKLVINRIAKVERTMRDHEARLRALETTRIVVRGLVAEAREGRRYGRKAKR